MCPSIHFHMKDTLVCISQNSNMCCDKTNELPNLNVKFDRARLNLD